MTTRNTSHWPGGQGGMLMSFPRRTETPSTHQDEIHEDVLDSTEAWMEREIEVEFPHWPAVEPYIIPDIYSDPYARTESVGGA